jgi:drug/metabolite transporter (DMT)-like permease
MAAQSRWVAFAALGLSMSMVGSYVALTKPLAWVFPVFLLGWLRFGIAAVAMLRWLRKPRSEAPWSRQTRWLVFLESFLGNFLFTLCMISGVRLTGAVSAGVIMALIPAMVALFSWLFLKESIERRVWLAIALGVAGTVLLSMSQAGAAGAQAGGAGLPTAYVWLGNALIFAAVVCEASYAVIGKKLTAVMGPRRISAVINLWGLVLMTPLGAWAAWSFDFALVQPGMWVLLVFYSLAASVWTVWLWMWGLRTVPAAQAGVFTVLLPLSAAVVGVVVLGEPFSPMQALAFVLSLLGLLLVTLPLTWLPGIFHKQLR